MKNQSTYTSEEIRASLMKILANPHTTDKSSARFLQIIRALRGNTPLPAGLRARATLVREVLLDVGLRDRLYRVLDARDRAGRATVERWRRNFVISRKKKNGGRRRPPVRWK